MPDSKTLTLEETAEKLVYTGINEAEGYSLTITKDDNVVEVHQVIPIGMATETWQELRDRLVGKI